MIIYKPLWKTMKKRNITKARANFRRCFDLDARMINPETLSDGWQTSGTAQIVRMAFNLWNGWAFETPADADTHRVSGAFTPDNLFCCEFAPYFFEAIRLRYPEYTGHIDEQGPSGWSPRAPGSNRLPEALTFSREFKAIVNGDLAKISWAISRMDIPHFL